MLKRGSHERCWPQHAASSSSSRMGGGDTLDIYFDIHFETRTQQRAVFLLPLKPPPNVSVCNLEPYS